MEVIFAKKSGKTNETIISFLKRNVTFVTVRAFYMKTEIWFQNPDYKIDIEYMNHFTENPFYKLIKKSEINFINLI